MAGLDGSNRLVESSASGCSTAKFTEVVLRGVGKKLGVWSHLLQISLSQPPFPNP